MRLITLNTWGGKKFIELISFIQKQAASTDFFCFQEVFSTNTEIKYSNGIRTNLQQELELVLAEHASFFAPALDGFDVKGKVNFDLHYGLSTFISKKFNVKDSYDTFVYLNRETKPEDHDAGNHPRNLQITKLEVDQKNLNIFNFHGLWTSTKLDTTERLKQSKKILESIKSTNGKTILAGDFNLKPETESIQMLDSSLDNLIKRFQISSTRSSLYLKPEKFADYIFISKDLNIKAFDVPNLKISDHRPLILDFTL